MAEDFAQWLNRLGLGQYAQAFADNDIGFEISPRLSDDKEPLAKSDRRIAAVDEEIGARHERGLVAGKKHRSISNFLGPSQPVE